MVLLKSALRPRAVFALPVVLLKSATIPLAVLLLPVVFSRSVRNPLAVLKLAVVFSKSAFIPLAVLKLPVVLLKSALVPLAVLLVPVVLRLKAPDPSAVFVDMAPAPLPTVKPDRVASVVEEIAPVTASAPEFTAASVEVPVAPSVVNAPVLAVESPTVVPFTEPPVMSTALASCVAIVPKPKFVRAVVAEAKSDKLLALNAYVVSAPVAVTPKLVRAVAASVAPVPPRTTESVPVVPATMGKPVALVRVATDAYLN